MTYVSFPGLGIEPFHMDRIAFSLFGIDVNWYGLIITCGMILAVLSKAMWHAIASVRDVEYAVQHGPKPVPKWCPM